MQPGRDMLARHRRRLSVALVMTAAFLTGAASAKLAVRTHRAIERVQREREVGGAGQLVQLEICGPDGEVVARPRLIAPSGKTAQLVLHHPERPQEVRLALTVEAVRDASGSIALDWSLWLPERAIAAKGKMSLTPGVEQATDIGEGTLVASFLALPVPSAAFDAYLEMEAARKLPGKTS